MAKEMTQEEKIKQMYAANLASQKETLQQDYQKADAEYVRQQEKAQKATDENLTRTAVEAQKEAVNNAEVNNATGLSSGARAQLRLSNQNQMHSDMTALRAQQQEIDAEIERSRSLLSQEYASAIRKAQQDNDLARAEALYKEAEKQEETCARSRSKPKPRRRQMHSQPHSFWPAPAITLVWVRSMACLMPRLQHSSLPTLRQKTKQKLQRKRKTALLQPRY